MRVIRGLARARGCFERPVVTIGNFDGVHKGHQVILAQVREDADHRGVDAVAVTFEPHPISVLRPQAAPRMLMQLGDRLAALAECGMDATVVQRFSLEFARIEADDFVRRFLVECLDVQKVIVGHDINFGRDRAGSATLLIEEGERYGFTVEVIRPVIVDGTVVHSSEVRALVQSGEVAAAAELLGRPHVVRGRCVHGAGVGRRLGIATINIRPRTPLVPPDGVYVTRTLVDGALVDGVTSIGSRPTFEGDGTVIESHLFEFDRDVYGRNVALRFLERLRDQRKFESREALVAQVRNDIVAARKFLASHPE